ncbi:MAG: hypothetical protein HYS27_21890 [Deltaproteobacteria bacterium]|nr:hypothetical protein [Deltaproteobacteria bacterium]
MLTLDPARSSFVAETIPTGLMARLGHDLRVEARHGTGRIVDDMRAEASFAVDAMHVQESRRHGTASWGPPPARDTAEIEERLREQVFPRVRAMTVRATLDGAHADLEVTAKDTWRGRVPVSVKHGDQLVEVTGTATLSLSALGGEQPRVPLGVMQLEDVVVVRFRATFAG